MRPYDEARQIDEKISDLIEMFPIESCPKDWMLFCRTVRSTLDIIDKSANDSSADLKLGIYEVKRP